MKIRGIGMSGGNPQAIIDGRKTQTRRTMKPQPLPCNHEGFVEAEWRNEPPKFELNGNEAHCVLCGNGIVMGGESVYKCPYGQVRDVLYVREEHYRYGHWEHDNTRKRKSGRQAWKFVADTDEFLFEAPAEFRKGRHHKDPFTPAWHKRNAMFMPKAAARIFLEITGLRVERLNDITEEDAIAEGVESEFDTYRDYLQIERLGSFIFTNPIDSFISLFDSINGPGSWERNDWVWVIEFKRIEKP